MDSENFEPLTNTVLNSLFFLGNNSGVKISSSLLKNGKLDIIEFNVRFRNSLKSFPKLISLNDLINIDYINF